MIKSFKFSLLISAVFLTVFLSSNYALAHPGNTDASGCHTCRTNCSSWGLYSGEYHCHNAKAAPQPKDPIKSTYGAGGTGYTSPAPEYKSPSYADPKPSCPSMSSYDSISKSCKCFSGYVVENDYSGNKACISGSSMCQKNLGYGSAYNSISGKCECNFGYILADNKCISESDYCKNALGFNSKFNSLNKRCECSYGYVIDNNKCISEDTYCNNILGNNSKYNSIKEKCECDFGYVPDGSNCVIEEVDIQESPADKIDIKTKTSSEYENTLPNDEPNRIEIASIQEKEIAQNNENIGLGGRIASFFKKLRFW